MTNNGNGWEYRIFAQHTGEIPRLSASAPLADMRGDMYSRMRTLGSEGWELVSTIQVDKDRLLLIFKRQAEELTATREA